jgi:hypothetical protein
MSKPAPVPTSPIGWKADHVKWRDTMSNLLLRNLDGVLKCSYTLELIAVFVLSFVNQDYALLCVLLVGLGLGISLLNAKERGRIEELSRAYPETLLRLDIFGSFLSQAVIYFAAFLVALLISAGAFRFPFLFFLVTFVYQVILGKAILYMPFGDRMVLYTDYLSNTILETRDNTSSSHEGVQTTMERFSWCLSLTNRYMLNEPGIRVRHVQSFLEAFRLMLYSTCPEERARLARQVRSIGSSVRSPEFPLGFVRSLKAMMGDTDLSPRGLSENVEAPTFETSLNEYMEQHPIIWNSIWLVLTGLFSVLLTLATRA